MLSIDDEWDQYLLNDGHEEDTKKVIDDGYKAEIDAPECEELYISTKTKVLFLNQEVDIKNVFWNIPITPYSFPKEGIIKKQMKIVSKTEEEYNEIKDHLTRQQYYTENVIKQINNPDARRIKFKDERKITIGMSKKDIMNARGKVKNAFYNCFAIIVRFRYNAMFREIHVKIFNTGKLEIPGVLNNEILCIVKDKLLLLLASLLPIMPEFVDTQNEHNVLINSNFNCGFYINRDMLFNILRNQYNIEASYDPCSYPGIKCKFYFNNSAHIAIEDQNGIIDKEDRSMKVYELIESKKYTEVSFMIFRTGSVLIIGNCAEYVLIHIYEFIRNILQTEYGHIVTHEEKNVVKVKPTKVRKKMINRPM
jgi:hypothetical protein